MRKIQVVVFLCCAVAAFAEQSFPLVISGCNHSIALPFGKPFRMDPLYPGLSAGTEYVYKEGNWGQIHQTGNLGFYVNTVTGTGIFLQTDFGYRYTAPFGLFGEASVGAGYMHQFSPRQGFELDSNGEYVEALDYGRPGATLGFGTALGFEIGKILHLRGPVAPFIRYQWFIQVPYLPDLEAGPQSLLHAGVRFSFWGT
ncbi:hypothetical protein JXM67_09240 [candidate division WOR-3 bacterium]|nr:hypothetical protein [candidate division WOR-3 bacterium]